MAYLRLSRPRTMINRTVDDNATSNPTAEGYIEDWICTHARPAECFAQRCHVRIVVHHRGHFRQRFQPGLEVEVGPPLDLMRTGDAPVGGVDRATEAGGDDPGVPLIGEFGN